MVADSALLAIQYFGRSSDHLIRVESILAKSFKRTGCPLFGYLRGILFLGNAIGNAHLPGIASQGLFAYVIAQFMDVDAPSIRVCLGDRGELWTAKCLHVLMLMASEDQIDARDLLGQSGILSKGLVCDRDHDVHALSAQVCDLLAHGLHWIFVLHPRFLILVESDSNQSNTNPIAIVVFHAEYDVLPYSWKRLAILLPYIS